MAAPGAPCEGWQHRSRIWDVVSLMCVCVCVVSGKRESRNIRADRAPNHSAADGALLETAVAALAHGEVAAWDEHYRARTGHANHADAVFLIGRWWRLQGYTVLWIWRLGFESRSAVWSVTPEFFSAGHEVRVGVDPLFILPLFVRPECLE